MLLQSALLKKVQPATSYRHSVSMASASNTAILDIYQGLYYRGHALVMPNIPELKPTILRELHDASYAGHVGSDRPTLSDGNYATPLPQRGSPASPLQTLVIIKAPQQHPC